MVTLDKSFYKNAIERVRSMPEEEYIQTLKRAGVLDADGRLAERYRPPSDEAANDDTSASDDHRVTRQR